MKKIWKIKRDSEAVSPVIATILMVAITVVLAAVLLVLVLNIGEDSVSVAGSISYVSDDPGEEVPGNLTVTFISQSIAKSDVRIDVNGNPLTEGAATGGSYNWTSPGTNIISGSVANITSNVPAGALIQLVQKSNGNVIAQTNAPESTS